MPAGQKLRGVPVARTLDHDGNAITFRVHGGGPVVSRMVNEQAQHGEANQEPVRHRTLAQPKSDPKRLALRPRQRIKLIENGSAQLVQRRERELHLRLDTADAHDSAVRGPLGQVLQQRRLAKSRDGAGETARPLRDGSRLLASQPTGGGSPMRFALRARRSAPRWLGHNSVGETIRLNG